MLEETILLKPEMDKGGLEKMFRDLNKRFSNITKAFGQGINMAMKAAPFLAIASLIASKLSSPLEKAEGIIDRILGKAGDLTDSAEELGTSPGALMRLETAFAKKGVTSDTTRMMLGKYQTAIAEEEQAKRTDPKYKPGLLSEFLGETDMVEGLFSLLNSLQGMEMTDRVIAFNSIFGQKMKGKVQAIVNEPNKAGLLEGVAPVEDFNKAIGMIDSKGDRLDAGRADAGANDLLKKSVLITSNMIENILTEEQRQLDKENQALKNYVSQQAMYAAAMAFMDKAGKLFDKVMQEFAPEIIAGLNKLSSALDTVTPYIKDGVSWLKEWGPKIYDETTKIGSKVGETVWNSFNLYKNVLTGKGFKK